MATANITTLTPVHIGSGTTFNRNIDFVQDGGRIGIVDSNKVAALIGIDKNAINQWVSAIYEGKSLVEFLRNNRGIKEVKIEDISERVCLLKNTQNQAANLKEHYRTVIEGLCIPGSSLKGAIKTAIWDNLTDEVFLGGISPSDLKNRKGHWDSDIVGSKLFGKSANEQSTRFLKIGDIHFGNAQSEIYELKILNKQFAKWNFKSGSNLIETIPARLTTQFNFKIDDVLLKRNLEKDIGSTKIWPTNKISYLNGGVKGLTKIVNEFTLSLIEWELEALSEAYIDENQSGELILNEYERICKVIENCRENELVIRLGGHSGWIFTTGGWVRHEDLKLNDSDMKSIRRTVQKNKEYSGMDLWPKTRKTTQSGTIFGFVKIQFS